MLVGLKVTRLGISICTTYLTCLGTYRGKFFTRNVGITDVVHLGVKDGQNFFWAEIIDLAVQKVGVVELDAGSSYLNRR